MTTHNLRVLVVGGGAREHAIAWKLRQSPRLSHLFVAPGNAGAAAIATNLDVAADDVSGIVGAARANAIALVVVGPEAPLAAGLVDACAAAGLAAFGPTRAAAEIESSKVFAKDLMERHGIPCARGAVFTDFEAARAYIEAQPTPLVVKADGLAAGKGVTVARSRDEALAALADAMQRRVFGAAGDRVIVEECLVGREVSLLAFTDGHTVVPMTPACDYKPVFDGDAGPNTGGMGGYSPPGFFGPAMVQQITATVLEPTVRALAAEGRPYRGVLYAGLMLTADGPKVLEFNCRFGDPETQVILPRLKSDLLEIILAVGDGTLDKTPIEWDDGACVGVVLVSGGYPGDYATGLAIEGFDCLDEGVLAFHAGTRRRDDGAIVTAGGRVLTVVAQGRSLAEARAKAYLNVPCLRFEGCHYRTDIAARDV